MLIQFLRFRPNLLMDFDPIGPLTPHQKVGGHVADPDQPVQQSVLYSVAGDVGEARLRVHRLRRIYEACRTSTSCWLHQGRGADCDPGQLFALSGALRIVPRRTLRQVWNSCSACPSTWS